MVEKRLLTDGLYDHGVDLIGTELEFIAREAMCETESHGGHVFLREPRHETVHLGADTAHQLMHVRVVHTVQIQLLLKHT